MDWTSANDLDRMCRQLVDEAQDAIVVSDREGVIRSWNRGAERIFGRPAAGTVGGSMDFIIPEKLRARHWDGYFKTMATGETKYGAETLNVPALKADGSRISIEFSIVLLRDAEGRPAGVAAIIRDVTARREKELELRKRLASLEAAAPGTPVTG
jgi:PAS domain S-box-containing protein